MNIKSISNEITFEITCNYIIKDNMFRLFHEMTFNEDQIESLINSGALTEL